MCGRVHQKGGELPWLPTEYGDTVPIPTSQFEDENFNASPGQMLWVIRKHPTSGKYVRDKLKWGFIPVWYKTMHQGANPFNARSEGIATNGMFRNAYAKRRCLVPIQDFFEWQKKLDANGKELKPRQPWAIAMADDTPFALGGIWESWTEPVSKEVIRSFAIVTTRANEMMAEIHDRMPVIITSPIAADRWLANIEPDPAELMKPYPSELMKKWRIGLKINRRGLGNVPYNAPDIMDPI